MGRVESEEILNLVIGLVDPSLYIQQQIIPAMMTRRGRVEPLSRDEITQKLFGVNPVKPGEAYELIDGELLIHGPELTPALAAEIADLIYYTSQPNCSEIMNDPSPLIDYLGVSMDQARRLCILKYLARMAIGDEESHKATENKILEEYLITQNYNLR